MHLKIRCSRILLAWHLASFFLAASGLMLCSLPLYGKIIALTLALFYGACGLKKLPFTANPWAIDHLTYTEPLWHLATPCILYTTTLQKAHILHLGMLCLHFRSCPTDENLIIVLAQDSLAKFDRAWLIHQLLLAEKA